MKVRLSEGEVRIRLVARDVAVLLDGGTVVCVVMPGRYVARITTSAHERSEVTFSSDGIDVTIPPRVLPEVPEEFESHVWGGDAGNPRVRVELDQHRRPRAGRN